MNGEHQQILNKERKREREMKIQSTKRNVRAECMGKRENVKS